MDLLPSVDLLRDHLMAHDRAVREIIMLDQYIEQLSDQTFLASMGECMTPAYKHMIRISVAEGMKRMYKEYRLQKWLKITEMAANVRRVLDAEVPPEVAMAHQGQLVQVNQPLPWQQINPHTVQNFQPMNTVHPVLSPIPAPLPPMISPINTPAQMTTTVISRHHLTGTTPEEFHQFAIANISANEEHFAGRQLFQDENSDIQVQYDYGMNCVNSFANDPIVIESDSEEIESEIVPHSAVSAASVQPWTGSGIPPHGVSENVRNENVYNQSGFPMIPQHQQQNFNELQEDNDEMEWDEDDDDDFSYNDSEDSLAGVLFATEHLLPDEQAVRLDVEMGDMGVGHVVFDRVSATWYIQHCEYYRAS